LEVAEPEVVVKQDECYRGVSYDGFRARQEGVRRTAGEEEEWWSEFYNGEVLQVLEVYYVAEYCESGEFEREAVDEAEEKLQGYYAVDEACEEFFAEYGVLFDEFREVVEAGCCVRLWLVNVGRWLARRTRTDCER
jgi:hypothetical protein